jgi:hypothetical protein
MTLPRKFSPSDTSNALVIEVEKAFDIPALSPETRVDPYVVLQLLPARATQTEKVKC